MLKNKKSENSKKLTNFTKNSKKSRNGKIHKNFKKNKNR